MQLSLIQQKGHYPKTHRIQLISGDSAVHCPERQQTHKVRKQLSFLHSLTSKNHWILLYFVVTSWCIKYFIIKCISCVLAYFATVAFSFLFYFPMGIFPFAVYVQLKNANGKCSLVGQYISLFHSNCYGELYLDVFPLTHFFQFALCFFSGFLPFCFIYWSSNLTVLGTWIPSATLDGSLSCHSTAYSSF